VEYKNGPEYTRMNKELKQAGEQTAQAQLSKVISGRAASFLSAPTRRLAGGRVYFETTNRRPLARIVHSIAHPMRLLCRLLIVPRRGMVCGL
jgi:hypothetical protein